MGVSPCAVFHPGEKTQNPLKLEWLMYLLLPLTFFMADQLTLHVNGEPRTCNSKTFLPNFLTQLGLNPRLVTVAYNGEILHRQFWEQTEMQPDDRNGGFICANVPIVL